MTDQELANAFLYACSREQDEEKWLNEICSRLGLPLEETEQGLTPDAAAKVDAFVTKNMTLEIPPFLREEVKCRKNRGNAHQI